jgi:hypothetical protein
MITKTIVLNLIAVSAFGLVALPASALDAMTFCEQKSVRSLMCA